MIKYFCCVCPTKLDIYFHNKTILNAANWANSVALLCGCSQRMDDCLPPGGATVQSPSYIISCVAMAMKPTMHTLHPWQSSGCKYLATLGPSCTVLLSAICHLDSRRAEVKYWMPGKGEKKKHKEGKEERIAHVHMESICTVIELFTVPLCQGQT